jgi:hypothetical protein
VWATGVGREARAEELMPRASEAGRELGAERIGEGFTQQKPPLAEVGQRERQVGGALEVFEHAQRGQLAQRGDGVDIEAWAHDGCGAQGHAAFGAERVQRVCVGRPGGGPDGVGSRGRGL